MNKICLSLSSTLNWETIKRTALRAERLGYHSVWFGDHLGHSPFFGAAPRFECWTLISALAPQLETLRVGPLVLANSFRNPALLAKMAATLDVISNGRLEMGIGAGGVQREYEAYGYECPPPAVRIRQMEEGIHIMKLLWTEEKPSFKGEHYWIRDSVCDPKPIQKPYPPLTIGGSGEKLTLRIVAREADRCNFITCDPEKIGHLLNVLRSHCKTIGRDFDEIEKSVYGRVYLFKNKQQMEAWLMKVGEAAEPENTFSDRSTAYRERAIFGTVDDCIERLRIYESLGVTCYILRFEGGERGIPHEEGFKLFNEHILDEIRR